MVHSHWLSPTQRPTPMKFYCHYVLSVNSSYRFHTSHLLVGLSVGLGLGQYEHTVSRKL